MKKFLEGFSKIGFTKTLVIILLIDSLIFTLSIDDLRNRVKDLEQQLTEQGK